MFAPQNQATPESEPYWAIIQNRQRPEKGLTVHNTQIDIALSIAGQKATMESVEEWAAYAHQNNLSAV
jgi:hypothetical protein